MYVLIELTNVTKLRVKGKNRYMLVEMTIIVPLVASMINDMSILITRLNKSNDILTYYKCIIINGVILFQVDFYG